MRECVGSGGRRARHAALLPIPFAPGRAVIGADQHAEFAAAFRARRPDLEYRGARLSDITADDLGWADTYIGFRRPALPTMGNVRWVRRR
ncbi:MAG TPA: hypothetical protein VH277_09315 [Gemmatimonadaceae bacterium]|nr:hypothetical protein [Gemmatimonadaceae bacterium]